MNIATAPDQNTALLWERLRALFARVIAAIGAPAIIAALTLTPHMCTEILRRIALVEIMARKLLLADAAALAPESERGPRLVEIKLRASGLYTAEVMRRPSSRSARAIDIANPETWSARFALAVPRDLRIVQDRRAPRIRALWGPTITPEPETRAARRELHPSAFRIARRAEALRRMLDDPAPYVRRLARCRRITGPARTHDIITRYAFRTPRRFVGDHTDPRLTLDIFSVVIRAHAVLADTS